MSYETANELLVSGLTPDEGKQLQTLISEKTLLGTPIAPDTSELDGDTLNATFHSSWTPPTDEFQRLSTQFPNATFLLSYVGLEVSFIGADAFRNGEQWNAEGSTYDELFPAFCASYELEEEPEDDEEREDLLNDAFYCDEEQGEPFLVEQELESVLSRLEDALEGEPNNPPYEDAVSFRKAMRENLASLVTV